MKNIFMAVPALFLGFSLYAQRSISPPTYTSDEATKGFKKENIFIGGGLNLGFASNTFAVGVSPEIGYSIASWLDAGMAFNVNYVSQRADPYYNNNVGQKSFSYGGGPFFRIYPIKVLFVQGQYESNWSNVTYNNLGYQTKYNYSSSSFIAGIGYAQRIVGQNNFYTLIGFDLMNDKNSPYNFNGSKYPIIKAGFDFYLRSSHKK